MAKIVRISDEKMLELEAATKSAEENNTLYSKKELGNALINATKEIVDLYDITPLLNGEHGDSISYALDRSQRERIEYAQKLFLNDK